MPDQDAEEFEQKHNSLCPVCREKSEEGKKMRKIIFRGKHSKKYSYTNEWVYGVPYFDCDNELVMTTSVCRFIVDPETVGEYTGHIDKRSKRIYEGDILRRTLKGTYPAISNIFKIEFIPVKAVFAAVDIDGGNVTFISDYINNKYEIEIIGNIHDNPELLEVKE